MRTIEDEINEARADELAEKEVMENQKEEACYYEMPDLKEYDTSVVIPHSMLIEFNRVSQNYKALLNFLGQHALFDKPRGYQMHFETPDEIFNFLRAIDEEACAKLQLKADYNTKNFRGII